MNKIINIKGLIEEIHKINKKKKDIKLEEFIINLCALKNEVVLTIKNGNNCFTIEDYKILALANRFFDKIEKWGNTRYNDVYKVTIDEKGLLKLDKELKKYNLNIY